MNRRLALAVVMLLAVGARAQSRGAVDWILVVDTSKSMVGIGKGTKNIFGEVQASLESFVRESSTGDSVSLYSFDRDVTFRGSTDIRAEFDRQEMVGLIRALEAKGDRTHLGAAIAKGLERADVLRRGRSSKTRTRAVVLFTDGKEDTRGIANPIPIDSNLARVGDSWVFFVSMGEHEKQLDQFRTAKVLRAPTAQAIRQVADDIRATLPKAPPKPPPLKLTVSPAAVDFGAIDPGERSLERDLTITSNRSTRVAVSLDATPGITMPAQENLTVTPTAPLQVKLILALADDAVAGPRTLTIRAAGQAIPATVTVLAPSPFVQAAKWLAALTILIAIALAARVKLAPRHHLEGEIEIVRPRVAADAAYVGLPHLKAREVALSSIVPPDALGGSDARLFVRRARGEKHVWIAAQGGTLRINDVEVPTAQLFDADTIRIGDATLRFNHIGHQRSQEDLA